MENEKDYTEIDLVEVFYVILDNARNIFVVTLCCVLIAAAYVYMQPKAAASYTSETLLRIKQMPNIMQTSKRNESLHSTMSEQSGGGMTDGMTNGLTDGFTNGLTDGQAMPIVDNTSVPYQSLSQTTNQNTSENWSTNTSENWSTSKSESKSASIDRSISTAGYGTLNLNQRLLTYAEILKSKSLMAAVTEKLGSSGTVAATPVKDTEMMKVTFTSNEAEAAQKGNELLVQAFQDYIAQKEQMETRYVVNSQAADAQKFGENATAEVVITNHVNVEVVDPPTHPSASAAAGNKKRTLGVSALLGVLLGSGYAVMHYLMNRRITTRQDIEDYLGLPVLAVVPEEKSLAEAMARQNDRSFLKKIGGLLWKEQN